MQHLQMKADLIAQQQMPPEAMQQYQQLQQQAQQSTPVDAAALQQQANEILAQFSSPIMTELMTQFAQQVATPPQEDPLVAIRKQELALKGQELQQEKEQFAIKEQMRADEKARQDQIDRERIDAQRDIARMKDDTTQDRLDQQKELKLIDIGLKQFDQFR
jgi:phosphatidate phosphatase PAH1